MSPSLCRAIHCALLFGASLVARASELPDAQQLVMLLPPATGQSAGVPAAAELERRRARIGRIEIIVDDVFEDAMSLSAPYRIVNSLHMSTHLSTVSQQLLFREGDVFDHRVLDESARLLREQRYLSDATVDTLRYNDDNTVDVMVRVHDVWTMSPGIAFGRKGGENSTRFEFEDTNFLGLGKTVALERTANVDRTAWRFGYVDPHVFGSWWRLSAAHAVLSDGSDDELSFGRPFYSMDSRWSAELGAVDSELTTPRYSLGKQTERFDTHQQTFGVSGGFSKGLVDGWAKRYLFGVRYDARSFAADPEYPTAFIPEDRRYVYPYAGIQWLEDSYITTRNLNQIGRTEDINLGRSLTVTLGLASTPLGSTTNALMLSTTGSAGAEIRDDEYLIGDFAASSRIESAGARNAQLDISGRYYKRQSDHRVLFAGIAASYTSHLDPDTQLMLGGDNGLRGYPLRYQAGTSRAVFTLEERFYTKWQPFKLVNVGAAVFADTGRMWGQDPFAAPPAGWLSDVGLGLRLGSARSGLGNILHIDVAFPLNRTDDIDSVQFLIETRKSF